MKAYTYLLHFVPENKYYYGVRYAVGCSKDDLFKTYFTSSKVVKELLLKHGKESFKFEIRKEFETTEKAMIWESKVLRRMHVTKNDKFLNKTDNSAIDPVDASKAMKGRKGNMHPAFGNKRNDVSERNKSAVGSKNPMYGKVGKDAPASRRIGELHPLYGKKSPWISEYCKQVVTCTHCNKKGKMAGMNRWHFDNCKLKGEIT